MPELQNYHSRSVLIWYWCPMQAAASPLTLPELRALIADALYPISAYELPSVCEGFGLAPGSNDDAFQGKRRYVTARLNVLSRGQTLEVARKVLVDYPNYELSEAVAKIDEAGGRRISDIIRQRIIRELNRFDLFGNLSITDFLSPIWPIAEMPTRYDATTTVADAIDRHMGRNDDWDSADLLRALGADTCSQTRFFALLEAAVHPRTRDEFWQEKIVASINPLLQRDGFALIERAKISGYPVYAVREMAGIEPPSDTVISDVLLAFDSEGVHAAWAKAIDRRTDDPEGAITAARTLLETVCKHIIEQAGGTYKPKDDLPKLYGTAAELLNLAPDQHTEKEFKAILGNCQRVVETLGSLRNRLSDAHGQGRRPVRPLPRHAELAVNLAGTMATFLVSTWNARSADKQGV